VSSVQGPDPAQAGQVASSRRLAWALTIAAMLLVAAFAAAPARAQEAPPVDPAATGDTTSSGDATQIPPSDPPPDPGTQTPPATDPPAPPVDQTPPDTPPPGDTPATGDGSTGGTGAGTGDATPPHRQPARDDGSVPTADSTSATGPTATAETDRQPSSPAATGGSDSWLGQDTFVLDDAGGSHSSGGATTVRRRFAGLFLLATSSRAKRMEARNRRSHETAKASALGGGPPGPGNRLPGHNPFFDLLSGSGGIGVSLVLASVLAVLGAAFVLPRERLKAFRTPTVTWSPLAYVPPIELPG
jgi:hypothetical protein